ncbi:MAG TPA: DNA topoisomerase IB [Opitutaceae bacterium]|nr:DNA topoisomerase IB [Opitutaceae bacterium]
MKVSRSQSSPRSVRFSSRSSPEPAAEAVNAAKKVGLRYVSDESPGISREKSRSGFRYRSPAGTLLRDAATLGRIKSLVIPPAWTEVWICPAANGHIQATGRDARGRKQYRYHPDWRTARDETKYERMIAFGQALPAIRRRVARDLNQRGLGRTKVLAAMVRLLETTLIRIGNEEYAKQNQSFGLSTMRDRHVSVGKGRLRFEFRGKSGKNHEIDLHEPRLAAIVRQTQDLPGQELFQYLDENGGRRSISSEDVNGYLREIAGEEFSAKDFRTWAGTVLAAVALREFEKFDSQAQAKKNLVAAIEKVAERLGNTPSICRKCYIHPVVLESYLAGETVEVIRSKTRRALKEDLAKLGGREAAVLAFLEQKLRQPKPSTADLLKKSVAQTASRRSRSKKR